MCWQLEMNNKNKRVCGQNKNKRDSLRRTDERTETTGATVSQ